jgi:RNA polymerase sigma factor (sigma-70 family)
VSSTPTAPDTLPSVENERWFTEHVYAHEGHLKAYLRGAFPAVREVDDVVQESYLRVWRRQLAKPISSAKGFLFKVARRLALDSLRHERASPIDRVTELDVSRVVDQGLDIAESACTQQEITLLLEAIESLPRRCREILILRKLQGMPQKEIAARLGLSEQTVQVQARRGLRRCDDYLRRRGVMRPSSP